MTTVSHGTAGTDAAASGPRRPAALLWWALGLIAAFALMGVAVAADAGAPFTQPLDAWWRGLVGASPDGWSHTWALPMFFQYLGEAPGALVMVILIPAGLAIVGRWRSALFFLSGVPLLDGTALAGDEEPRRPAAAGGG